MKRNLIVLIMILLSVFIVVSCDDKAGESGSTTDYKVGDKGPAGGVIFYVNPNAVKDGWTYLEAAPGDLEVVDEEGTRSDIKWGTKYDNLGTGTEIGDGYENTKTFYEADPNGSYEAAFNVYGKDLYGNEYTDWFIPSKAELVILHENRNLDGLKDTLESNNYWSSSECVARGTGKTIWALSFNGDGKEPEAFDIFRYCYVRPIRRF